MEQHAAVLIVSPTGWEAHAVERLRRHQHYVHRALAKVLELPGRASA